MAGTTTTAASSLFRVRPAIILFGDSLTEYGFGEKGRAVGWASLLANAYTRRADVFNRGFSGYNTAHAVDILPKIFGSCNDESGEKREQSTLGLSSGVLFCTIFFGANDAALPGDPQHVPLERYTNNLNRMVTTLRERVVYCPAGSPNVQRRKNVPIVLLTPPPVHEASWMAAKELEKCNRDNDVTRTYGQAMKQVAEQHEDCSVLDTWELLQGGSEERKAHLHDGLHLSESGNRRVFEGLLQLLRAEYPDMAPMDDSDGDGKYGESGIPKEEKLWGELC